jgi:hypothetical protein
MVSKIFAAHYKINTGMKYMYRIGITVNGLNITRESEDNRSTTEWRQTSAEIQAGEKKACIYLFICSLFIDAF